MKNMAHCAIDPEFFVPQWRGYLAWMIHDFKPSVISRNSDLFELMKSFWIRVWHENCNWHLVDKTEKKEILISSFIERFRVYSLDHKIASSNVILIVPLIPSNVNKCESYAEISEIVNLANLGSLILFEKFHFTCQIVLGHKQPLTETSRILQHNDTQFFKHSGYMIELHEYSSA